MGGDTMNCEEPVAKILGGTGRRPSCRKGMTPLPEPAPVPEIPVRHGAAGVLSTVMTVVKSRWFFGMPKTSPAYKFFVKPSHVLMLLGIILVSVSMVTMKTSNVQSSKVVKPRTLVYFVYLAAFCLHLGSQIWMTFVSGLSLYFNLCKQTFGEVQRILFPIYFVYNSLLSAITIIQFGKIHSTSIVVYVNTYRQLYPLSICFLLELMIWLYFVPVLLRVMDGINALEKAAGIGTKIGHYEVGPLASCPHYMKMRRVFRRIHSIMAGCNIATIICSIIHLAYIAA